MCSTRRESRTGRIERIESVLKIQKSQNRLTIAKVDDRIIELSHEGLVNRGTKKFRKSVDKTIRR